MLYRCSKHPVPGDTQPSVSKRVCHPCALASQRGAFSTLSMMPTKEASCILQTYNLCVKCYLAVSEQHFLARRQGTSDETPYMRPSENYEKAKFEVHPSMRLLDIALYALCIPKVMNFRKFCKGEVRRIPIPRTRVNKGKKKAEAQKGPRPTEAR